MPITYGHLLVEPIGDGRTAYVHEPFIYHSEIVGDISIDGGWITDYNSVPWVAQRILPPWLYPLAAVVHDWLFRRGCADEGPITLSQANQVHREIMRELKAEDWRIRAVYIGLCIGSWVSWNRYRKAEANAAANR